MISYGSQAERAVMPLSIHSHQLGEGHQCGAAMPMCHHPSRSVYGGQKSATGTSPRHRLHQLGEGHPECTEMSSSGHPPRSVYGSQSRYAEMPCNQLLPPVRGGSQSSRSNAPVNTPSSISFTEATSFKPKGQSYIASKGKGQTNHATMSPVFRPSPPVYGGQKSSTGSSHRHRLHQFTGAFVTTQQCPSMIAPTYLPREGSSCPRRNAIHGSPFPTSLWKEHQ